MSSVRSLRRSLRSSSGATEAARRERIVAAPSSRVYLPAFAMAVVAVLVGFGWSDPLGWCELHRLHDESSCRRGRPTDPSGSSGSFSSWSEYRPAQRRPLFARGYRQDLLYTVLNATLVAPLVTALTLSFSDVVRRALPWIVLPRIGTRAPLGGDRRDLRRDGRVQLVSPIWRTTASECSGASTSFTIPKRT